MNNLRFEALRKIATSRDDLLMRQKRIDLIILPANVLDENKLQNFLSKIRL